MESARTQTSTKLAIMTFKSMLSYIPGMYVYETKKRALHERAVLHGQAAVAVQAVPEEGVIGHTVRAPGRLGGCIRYDNQEGIAEGRRRGV